MNRLRKLSAWTDKHPIAAILLGMFALWLILVTLLPADPPYLNQNQHRSAT